MDVDVDVGFTSVNKCWAPTSLMLLYPRFNHLRVLLVPSISPSKIPLLDPS